jgi:hypothetical protein
LQIVSKSGVAWLTMPCTIIFLLIFLIVSVHSSSAIEVVPSENFKTCYDYAVKYSATNPDWGLVVISRNQFFRGPSHMLNYKVLPDGDLLIHDESIKKDYVMHEWKNSNLFYHFLLGERPVRNYWFLQDNSQLIGAIPN